MQEKQLKQVIRACQAGVGVGFDELVGEYGPRLYRYFSRSCGQVDAEDLLQELFLRLLKTIKEYRHEDQDHFERWLFRVAANLVRDRHRKSGRSKETVWPSVGGRDDPRGGLAEPAGDGIGPEEQVLKDEEADLLGKALEQLSGQEREMVLLRYYGQMPFSDLARMFKMPLGTALAKVHRGLKKLKTLLEEK